MLAVVVGIKTCRFLSECLDSYTLLVANEQKHVKIKQFSLWQAQKSLRPECFNLQSRWSLAEFNGCSPCHHCALMNNVFGNNAEEWCWFYQHRFSEVKWSEVKGRGQGGDGDGSGRREEVLRPEASCGEWFIFMLMWFVMLLFMLKKEIRAR